MIGDDRRTGRAELVVGDRGPGAGAGLDQHLVPVAGELVDTGGRDGDPVLVVLDLGRHADLHATLLMRTSRLFADHVTINSGPLGPPSPKFRLGRRTGGGLRLPGPIEYGARVTSVNPYRPGRTHTSRTFPVVPPIYQTTTFELDETSYADIQSAGGLHETWYSRFNNPTVDAAAAEVARLHGARQSPGHRQRHGGDRHHPGHPAAQRRHAAGLQAGLRRHRRSAAPRPAGAGHRGGPDRRLRHRRLDPPDQDPPAGGGLRRDPVQSRPAADGRARDRPGGARGRCPARRRQHVRDAVLHQAAGTGRRRGGRVGDQVPGRPLRRGGRRGDHR